MSEKKELATREEKMISRDTGFLSPAATLQELIDRYEIQKQFISTVLKEGVDYGKIPGTNDKDVLFKAGAEKLVTLYGLKPDLVLEQEVEDWDGSDHDGEPFFYYRYSANLYKGDQMVANSQGSCNSWEKKYRYRTAEMVCPACENQGTVIKGKEEYGGGWICWGKKGGCGAKFSDNDPKIVNQERGQVKNPNPYDLVNTIQKMAQKRALVAAALIVGNASDYFTQDIEDMDYGDVIEGSFREVPEQKTPAAKKPAPKPEPMPTPENTDSEKLDDVDLDDDIVGALARFEREQPELYPKSQLDWETAYDWVDSRDDVSRKDVQNLMQEHGDLRICMAHLLGYLD